MSLLTLAVAIRGCSPIPETRAVPEAWGDGGPLASPGHVEVVDFLLEPPPGHITAADCNMPARVWQLPGYTPAAFTSLLHAAGLEERDARAFDSAVQCGPNGCMGSPDHELLTGLRPDQRAVLYSALGRFTVNAFQFYPFWRRANLGPWSARRGLSPEARALLNQLTYTEGDRLLLADMPVLCTRLRDERDKVLALESLMSRSAIVAYLHIDAGTDLDAVIRYWAWGRPAPDVRRVLSVAQRDAGEAMVDVTGLLPPFARARVNRYPGRGGAPFDCSWSALHFFDGEAPDETLVDRVAFDEALARDYVQVPFEDRRLGDIVRLGKADGSPVHVANHVAGDIVFTKNGGTHVVPWMLERLADVEWRYHEATVRTAYRLRKLAGSTR